ncbi:hypothetical protein D3C71_1236030 [compost metagenome]
MHNNASIFKHFVSPGMVAVIVRVHHICGRAAVAYFLKSLPHFPRMEQIEERVIHQPFTLVDEPGIGPTDPAIRRNTDKDAICDFKKFNARFLNNTSILHENSPFRICFGVRHTDYVLL